MATPTNGNFRNTFVSPALSVIDRDLTLIQCAVEAKEDSYSSTNFDDLITALEAARSAVADAQTADTALGNPS